MNTKKIVTISGLIIGILALVFLGWKVLFEKQYIFGKQDAQLLEAGKKYFDQNKSLLPKENGVTRKVDLQTLYDQKWIDTLYIPKSKKMCNTTTSFVRVKKEKNKYTYESFLACGKYNSTNDTTSPTITLNGKKEIIVDKGSTYQELGVKDVTDNVDKLKVTDVVIDSSGVKTNEVGTYQVRYTITDNSYNKAVVKRTIKVVEMLNSITKNNTDESNHYKGKIENNYLLFSGMLFRIVGVNEDGTTKIILNHNVGNTSYGSDNFNDSDVLKWLTDNFYKKLNDNSKKYIYKDSTWCIDTLDNTTTAKLTCDTYSKKSPVGLLSIQDYNKTLTGTRTSFISGIHRFWLSSNYKTEDNVDRNYTLLNKDPYAFANTEIIGVRPVINLNSDIYIKDGKGTINNPYKLDDYDYANPNAKLNKRLIGEYINISGELFRISDIDKDGNIKVIMDGVIRANGEPLNFTWNDSKNIYLYKSSEKGNIGYIINNDSDKYIDTSLFIKTNFVVPIYEINKAYNSQKQEKITAKLAAPSMYEIFSTPNVEDYYSYWLINSSKEENQPFIMANRGAVTYNKTLNYSTAGLKLSGYLDKDVKIKSGKGTRENPYYIKKG